MPPPIRASRALLPVVSLLMPLLSLIRSLAVTHEISIDSLANLISSSAFFSLIPAASSSATVAVARASIVEKPISLSFSAVAGPTPGSSEMSV